MSLLKSQIKAPEKSTSDVVSYIDCDTSNQNVDPIAEDITSMFDIGDKFEKRKHRLQQDDTKRYVCGVCENKFTAFSFVKKHLKVDHNLLKLVVLLKRMTKGVYQFVVSEAPNSKIAKKPGKRKSSGKNNDKSSSTVKLERIGLHNVDSLAIAHVQDELMFCALCKFSTKVRVNLVKHLQLHAKQQAVPQTNPVKSVPHLDKAEKHVDAMTTVAYSSLSPQIDKSKEVETLNPFVGEKNEAVHSTCNANYNVSKEVNATPTMDLKPWQCGLCKFKSMLLPEVVNHCAIEHQSKMQYKCVYCVYKTSNMDNITKHQSQSHADRIANTFYSYYREGSVPDEPDGTPRWQKQRQISQSAAQVKAAEILKNKEPGPQNSSSKTSVTPTPITMDLVDLNIIKEDPAADPPEGPVDDFCGSFGLICEPNGLEYKCPLCKIVSEENREAMQSHLYEELQYRKWGCGFCPYKAFHKNDLKEHMITEHRQYREPIELPVDSRVEIWIAKALDHQFLLIEKGRQNIAKQAVVNPKSKQAVPALACESGDQCDANNLQIMFGSFGEPEGMQFSCPKCNYKVREESQMRDHLEIELNKIRWCCNGCTQKFQNYHEAQFHCKSKHPGQAARAVEAVRDRGTRGAWLSVLLLTQKLSMWC